MYEYSSCTWHQGKVNRDNKSIPLLKVQAAGLLQGDRIFISMHLCKEYARSATTHTDNTRNIYEKVP